MCCSLSPDSPPYAVPNPEPMIASVVAIEESDEEGKMGEAAAYPQAENKTQPEEENKTKKKKSSKERSMSMFSDYIM